MSTFDDLLESLLDEPEEVLGILNDVVNRGRLQASDLPAETLETLADHDLVTFLIQRFPRQPLRTWVYPTPLGLRVFAVLEREADRLEQEEKHRAQRVRQRQPRGGGRHGVSR